LRFENEWRLVSLTPVFAGMTTLIIHSVLDKESSFFCVGVNAAGYQLLLV
jgi:hypothetical protein